MPTPTPPYQFIAIARTIARGFNEQAIGHPEGEALTEAARAIWRGIEVLEGMDKRNRPGEARCGPGRRPCICETVTELSSAAWIIGERNRFPATLLRY